MASNSLEESLAVASAIVAAWRMSGTCNPNILLLD